MRTAYNTHIYIEYSYTHSYNRNKQSSLYFTPPEPQMQNREIHCKLTGPTGQPSSHPPTLPLQQKGIFERITAICVWLYVQITGVQYATIVVSKFNACAKL